MADAAERRFAAVAARFLEEPDVTEGTGFGKTPGLRTGGKIFAMLMPERLVVKLPRERVDELVATGAADRLESGQGRPMKEWASIDAGGPDDWEAIAAEARRFVRGSGDSRDRSTVVQPSRHPTL